MTRCKVQRLNHPPPPTRRTCTKRTRVVTLLKICGAPQTGSGGRHIAVQGRRPSGCPFPPVSPPVFFVEKQAAFP